MEEIKSLDYGQVFHHGVKAKLSMNANRFPTEKGRKSKGLVVTFQWIPFD